MKPLALILFLLCAFASNSFSQNTSRDSIIMTGSAMGGIKFFQDGKRTNMEMMSERLSHNPEAFRYIQKAKTNNVLSFIFAFAGGFIIGWEIGQSIGNRPASWPAIGVGVGCVGLAIPFGIGMKKNAKKAVDIYNSSLR